MVTRITSSDGFGLATDVVGTADRPPLVLLHGVGQTRHSWKAGASAFADAGFHVLAVDARGHGDSDRSPVGDYSLDALKRDVAAIVATLAEPPILVGASMGGLTALLFAGETPSPPLRGLVLVDITVKVDPAGVERIMGFLHAHLDGFASLDEAADAIARYNPHRKRPPSAAGLAQVLRLRHGRYHWHWDPRFVTTGTHPGANEDRLAAASRGIAVPTLLVRAGASDLVGMKELRHMRALIPHAEAVDVADAGHMIAGDRNDAFVAAILPFLRGIVGAPAPT
jgi:pimeloyl-ACP methyl ester carboxylesterase